MPTIWFNQGYSSIRDAILMIREASAGSVCLLASHADPDAPMRTVADDGFDEPDIDRSIPEGAEAYADWCLATARARGVDLFVPQGGRSAVAVRAAEFAAAGIRLSVPADAATLALIDDKARFYDAATAAGLPLAWTREVVDAAGFDAALADLAAQSLDPCVKPPQGVFGAGFWRLDERVSLFDALMNPDAHRASAAAIRAALDGTPGQRLLVMEHLAGPEWSVDCVCKDGALVAAVSRIKLGRAQRLEVDGPAVDIARAAIRAFGLSGLINVQCRAAAPGDVRLLEINTRMSGGCGYTAHAGVNLPWIHVAIELGLLDPAQVAMPTPGAMVVATTVSEVVGHA